MKNWGKAGTNYKSFIVDTREEGEVVDLQGDVT